MGNIKSFEKNENYQYFEEGPVQLVFSIVSRDSGLKGIEYRDNTNISLDYKNEKDLVEKVNGKDIVAFKNDIKSAFENMGRKLSDDEYIDVYIQPKED